MEETNQLIIKINDSEDSILELSGKLNTQGFSGYGAAWFNNSSVTEFISKLHLLSKGSEEKVKLIGGQGEIGSPDYLVTLGITCYWLSSVSAINGIVGVFINMAHKTSGTNGRKEETLKVCGELQLRSQQIAKVAQDLEGLMEGKINEACFIGDLKRL